MIDLDWIQLIANTIPQFLFAIVLFWLCQSNGDKQRQAYQEQINRLYSMLEKMLMEVSRAMDFIDK